MSAHLPWERWTAAPAPSVQLTADRTAPPAPLDWWGLVGAAPIPATTSAPPRSTPSETAPRPTAPAPSSATGEPRTALGQLAQATAEAQRATADAHTLWLRQQDESLALIAQLVAGLTPLLPAEEPDSR